MSDYDSSRPDPAGSSRETAEDDGSGREDRGGVFRPLNLRDRVVIMLLFDQIVTEEQVARAWKLWRQQQSFGVKMPLWRTLLLFPELDRELIYAEAARVFNFEEVRISRREAVLHLRLMEQQFKEDVWDRLVELRTIPVAASEDSRHRDRLVFASQDPTRPEVHHLLKSLGLPGYELRYAPERKIVELLAEAFPERYRRLKEDLEPTAPRTPPDTRIADALADLEDDEPTPAGRPTGVGVFEEVLVALVRADADAACVIPNEHGETEVYLQTGDEIRRWSVTGQAKPYALLAAVRGELLRSEVSDGGDPENWSVKRWIDGRLVRFGVKLLPPKPDVRLESVVIRVLG